MEDAHFREGMREEMTAAKRRLDEQKMDPVWTEKAINLFNEWDANRDARLSGQELYNLLEDFFIRTAAALASLPDSVDFLPELDCMEVSRILKRFGRLLKGKALTKREWQSLFEELTIMVAEVRAAGVVLYRLTHEGESPKVQRLSSTMVKKKKVQNQGGNSRAPQQQQSPNLRETEGSGSGEGASPQQVRVRVQEDPHREQGEGERAQERQDKLLMVDQVTGYYFSSETIQSNLRVRFEELEDQQGQVAEISALASVFLDVLEGLLEYCEQSQLFVNLTPFTHEIACDILGGADSDADGFLSWEEFQLAVEQTCIEAVRQSILAEPEDEQGPQENLQRPEPEFLDPEEEVEVVVENPQVEVSLLDDPVNGSAAREDPEFQTQMQEFSESLEETMHAIVSSKEFRNKLRVDFSNSDVNRDGLVPLQELVFQLQDAIPLLNNALLEIESDLVIRVPSQDQVLEVLEAFDKNRDRELSLEEFLTVVQFVGERMALLEAVRHLEQQYLEQEQM